MKKMLIAVLTLLLMATLLTTTATAQVEVVSIPDANLAAAIREALGLPTDAVITADAMLDLTKLVAPGKGITALTGLEYATQLEWLSLSNTDVSDVSALANLTQLKDLSLRTTHVSDVSALAPLTQLERLDLEGTHVSDVSALAPLTQLKMLYLGGTGVSDVSALAPLTQLAWLYLSFTHVSDISALAPLTQLEMLSLSGTDVSDISALANLTQLKTLSLYGLGVSDISALANLTQLARLELEGTHVSDVSVLANFTQLAWLDLGGTAVSDVSVLANLRQLKTLNLHTTHVSDVSALANLTQLEALNLQNCPLNADAHQVHIPVIQANGTEVLFDPFKPIHLPRVPGLVSLIYFRPSDRPVRPNVDAEIDGLIKKAQRFFADQLELHGFGRKTFQFETDAHGNAVVHHVNGKFPNAHYQNSSYLWVSSYSWVDEIREQIYIPARSITVHMLDSAPGTNFTGAGGTGGGGNYGGSAHIDDWSLSLLAHELAHAFGLAHDWRADANAKRIRTFIEDSMSRTFTLDSMLTSFCAAEWLSVHPAFNPGQPVSTSNATIKMLPPTLASPPNTIRLRFEVTDLDGLHQAQLQISDFVFHGQDRGLIDCQRLHGRHSTVEFVTTALTPQIEGVTLSVIDVRGHMSAQFFPIDVPSLLPPAKVVSIPDPNLAAAVREALELSVSEAITTHAMLALLRLSIRNRGIKDFTGLEHAVNLEEVNLDAEYISGEGYVNSNAISNWSPLAALTHLSSLNLAYTAVSDISSLSALTQLTSLELHHTAVSDVSALANLTQLKTLNLSSTAVSDISALANLTQLETLDLGGTAVSDVSPLLGLNLPGTLNSIGLHLIGSPLSHASIHTHIPAMQAKGIGVKFDNRAHQAILKIAGDGQEGAPATTLNTPLVVEAMDEHGKPMAGKTVQFENLQGGGMLSATAVKTDARGKARVTLMLGRAPGVNKVKASSEGIQSWVLFTAVGTGAVPQLVADVNGDGVVDLADLAIVAQAMGKPVQNLRADVNGDGVVDGEDFAQVAAHLGEGEAAAPSQAALPAGLTLEKVEWALNLLHAENTGSPAFRRGIAKLEGFLARLIPDKTLLLANYPNPFNPETWIPYQLANPAEVTVTIYAANGAVVRTLALGHQRAGSYESKARAAYWDGRNAQGEPVASGIYFYTLTAGDFAATRKMLILK